MSDGNMAQADQDRKSPAPAPDRDGVLQLIVSLVQNNDDGGLPITLSINGMLVSGVVVSARSHLEELSKSLGLTIFGSEESETRSIFEQNIAKLAGSPTDEPPPADELNFIHLRDAKFFDANGGSMNVTSKLSWRGRISEVSGWSLGAFSRAD